MQAHKDDLKLLTDAARASAEIAKGFFKSDPQVWDKDDDAGPVTEADLAIDTMLKQTLQAARPTYGWLSEETEDDTARLSCDRVFIVDPIDGTKSFVRGYPFFSTQIALMKGNEFIVGVSNAPGFKEMTYAEKGYGAWLNGEQIVVGDIAELNQATLSLGNIASIAGKPQWQTIGGLIQEVHRIRGYGDFYHYHLLASGKIDIVIESDVNILDIAALSVIVNEAGGHFTDLSGAQLTLDTTSVLACNLTTTHQQLVERLNYVNLGLT